MARPRRITGHVVLEDRQAGPRVWVAKYMRAEGAPTRKVLGPAWAKPARREPERGAPVTKRWRAADGTKPDGYVTPQEAQDQLDALLAVERAKDAQEARTRRSHGGHGGKTFGDACDAYLEYVEREGIAPSTLRRYRGIVSVQLKPAFGERTPLRRVNQRGRIDAYREELVHGDLSRSSARQTMVVLNGILKRAQRTGWISHNAAAVVESIPTAKASGDFNVLEPATVEKVARAATGGWAPVEPGDRGTRPNGAGGGKPATRISLKRAQALTDQHRADAELYGAVIRFAAYTGLRLGELRALRWRDIMWKDSIVHVRLNAPTSAPAASAEKRPKSELVRSVPLTDEAARAIEPLSRREHFTGLDDRVFPSPTGGPMDGGKVRDAFYGALDVAGLGHLREKDPDPVVFHDLRHTFGTLAVRVAPITDVKAWMGHADLSTTMRYVHHVPQVDAAKRLSQAFAVESNPLADDAGAGDNLAAAPASSGRHSNDQR